MASDDNNPDQINSVSPAPTNPSSSVPWKERILIPLCSQGLLVELSDQYRSIEKFMGFPKYRPRMRLILLSSPVATADMAGAREFVRVSRNGKPDDLLNSVIGGFGSGAILGRLQGGQTGAARYSILFAAVGTAVDYATVAIMPSAAAMLSKFVAEKKESWLRLPEWSPIRVLDEEAVAEKRAPEQQIFRKIHNFHKEE